MARHREPGHDDVQIENRTVFLGLPVWARIALQDGLHRLERIRIAIASQSPVRWMPPVNLVPEFWYAPSHDAVINGMTSIVRRGKARYFGARVPAQIVAAPDDLFRQILVHEFSHCFRHNELILDHVDSGSEGSKVELPSDEEANHARLDHWFGPDDSKTLMRWHDRARDLQDAMEPFLRRWASDGLPACSPDRELSADRVDIPIPVMDRIRALRDSR